MPKLSLAASLSSKSLTLHLRQTMSGGISQRLGELTLNAAPDYEIDTLEWTATAIRRGEDLTTQRDSAIAKAKESEQRVKSLAAQLEELVSVRKESEDQMLIAFADVLNTKKRKVRELQRMVEELRMSGDNDQEKGESKDDRSKDTMRDEKKRAPGTSRRGKRKAKEEPRDDDESKMAIDGAEEHAEGSEDSGEFERMRSPAAEREDDSTEQDTGDEGDGAEGPAEPAKRRVGTIGGRKMDAGSDKASDEKMVEGDQTATSGSQKPQDPPPPRELPFTRQREAAQRQDEGEETSDDEL
jgi:hypothetical protein